MFGPYIVAVLDFVGQSAELAKWDRMPSPREMEDFLSATRNTFGRILAWREKFQSDFAQWLAAFDVPDHLAQSLPDRAEAYRRFVKTSIGFCHFSDTLIVYSPLVNEHGHASFAGAYGLLLTCGLHMVAALADGVVFRGGIDVGVGAKFPEADLYGPCLAKAHYLESKVADYPRIAVGSSLVALLDDGAASGVIGPSRFAANLSRKCLSRDDDGSWFLDYLGRGFAEGIPDEDEDKLEALRSAARVFVDQELDRFRREGNEKLTKRYERLAGYFRAREVSDP